jgi:hypothetical protein
MTRSERIRSRRGQYLTSRGSQFTADIAAVGHFYRGYRRTRLVFDISTGTPRIVHRQDLGPSRLGAGRERPQKPDTLSAEQSQSMNLFKKQRATSCPRTFVRRQSARRRRVAPEQRLAAIAENVQRIARAVSPRRRTANWWAARIRNHLEEAGIRERHCIVALPLSSALSVLTEIP